MVTDDWTDCLRGDYGFFGILFLVSTMKHKHHIIPRYKCEELGIDPDFPENIVEVDRLDHARIHWGYKCDDLEPLFEHVTPAQWIIDLIPRGDNRDVGASVITARGEIDEIDMFGKNNPNYKHGRAVGWKSNPKVQKENDRIRNAEYHANNREKERARMRAYYHRKKAERQGPGTLKEFMS